MAAPFVAPAGALEGTRRRLEEALARRDEAAAKERGGKKPRAAQTETLVSKKPAAQKTSCLHTSSPTTVAPAEPSSSSSPVAWRKGKVYTLEDQEVFRVYPDTMLFPKKDFKISWKRCGRAAAWQKVIQKLEAA